jgi:DNA-binding CsgD family transcriptional regulator
MLTKRDEEMLNGLVAGKTTIELAESMGLTSGTIRVYLHGLYKKIGVRHMTEAAVWWVRRKRRARK